MKMKKKRIWAAIIAAAMTLSFASCGDKKESSSSKADTEANASETTEPAEETTEDTETTTKDGSAAANPFGETADINEYIKTTDINPPLWKVTDPESGNTMYLLGTIHMLPADISDYPSELMDIYGSCDSIAVEYDTTVLASDVQVQMEYVSAMIYSDGTTIKDHLSEETYNKAVAYFESIGAYSELLDQYTTGYWVNQLGSINLFRLENMDLSGTDTYFITKAKEDGKEVINIEELSMQTDALNAYSDDYADYSISEMIDNMDDIDDFAKSYSELYELWATGSGDILFDMDNEYDELPDDLKDDYDAYVKVFLDDRNEHMAKKAAEYIREGKNCLFMVGSAHYSGDNGVDNLLEAMGFTVEKIA